MSVASYPTVKELIGRGTRDVSGVPSVDSPELTLSDWLLSETVNVLLLLLSAWRMRRANAMLRGVRLERWFRPLHAIGLLATVSRAVALGMADRCVEERGRTVSWLGGVESETVWYCEDDSSR